MTEQTNQAEARVGQQIHFLKTGVGYMVEIESRLETRFSQRGQTITITPGIYAGSLDRNGESWLDKEQGESPWWGAGAAPESVQWWTPGTTEADVARKDAHTKAHKIADPSERDAELRRIRKVFGNKPTSTTLRTVGI